MISKNYSPLLQSKSHISTRLAKKLSLCSHHYLDQTADCQNPILVRQEPKLIAKSLAERQSSPDSSIRSPNSNKKVPQLFTPRRDILKVCQSLSPDNLKQKTKRYLSRLSFIEGKSSRLAQIIKLSSRLPSDKQKISENASVSKKYLKPLILKHKPRAQFKTLEPPKEPRSTRPEIEIPTFRSQLLSTIGERQKFSGWENDTEDFQMPEQGHDISSSY